MLLTHTPSIKNNYFSLTITHADEETNMIMKMLSPVFNTEQIPLTCDFLDTYLPSIYSSKCFNEEKLSFIKEVKKTELGHLFEHILLEYIYTLKVARGYKKIIVRGETSWNWERDEKGIFHITINVGSLERQIFYEALTPSLTLFQVIVKSCPTIDLGAKLLLEKTLPLPAAKKDLLR